MAPLTWREVSSPNFGSSNQLWEVAANLMNRGFDAARGGLKDYRDMQTDQQSGALMQQVIAAGGDTSKIAAVTGAANPAYLSPAALNFANNQAGVLLNREGDRLNNQARGQNIRTNDFNFTNAQTDRARSDAEYAARPQAIADAQTLWTDLNSADPAVRQAATGRQADFLKTNGAALGIDSADKFNTFMTNGMKYQDTVMQGDVTRIGHAKALDNAVTENDAKNITASSLSLYGNNADKAISVVSADPRIDPTTKIETLKQLNAYKTAVPGKSAADAALENTTLFPDAGGGQSVLPTLPSGSPTTQAPAAPARRSNVDNVLQGLVDKTEGGGNYNTLYGNAQNKGPLAGVDVSKQTIGSLKQFASSNGAYGQTQRDKLGYLATPMGRYQIVGATMAATAKKLGLGDDVVFTPEVQDAMFNKIASDAISGPKTMEGKMAALRGQWEGFKNVSNSQLSAAITAYQNGSPLDLNNLQRGEVNSIMAGSPAVDAQRDYQASLAQNGQVIPPLRTAAGDQAALTLSNANQVNTALAQASGAPLVNAPITPTTGNVDANTLLAQQAANNTSVTPTADATSQLTAAASAQTASNNAAIDAAVVKTPSTSGSEDLSKDIKVSDDLTIPGVNDKQSGFSRDFSNNRDVAINTALGDIRNKLGPLGRNNASNALNATYDYFMADTATAEKNAGDRQKGLDADNFYQSDAARQYFSQNPSKLKDALADPVGFANTVGKTATQNSTSTAPFAPKAAQTPAQQDQNMATMAATRTRALNNSETIDQMFSAVNNTSALNQTNELYPSIASAIRDSTNTDKSAADVASELTSKGGKDGKDGALAPYTHEEVTNAIQNIRDQVGVNPTIAGALLKEVGTYDNSWFNFGPKYDVRDMGRVKDLWANYQRNANASNGVSSLMNSDLTKYQQQQVALIQKQVTSSEAALKAAIADPNTDPAKVALYQQQLAQLPKQTKAALNNIMSSGALNNNLTTKPER